MASDASTTTCVDCDREITRRTATRVMVHMDKPDGGYDRVPMYACRQCALKRRGYQCDHCGEYHETLLAADECCVGQTKAPDCQACGRRMSVGAKGYGPIEGETITWAECDCCPIGWGQYTGWEQLDGDCKHVGGGDGDAR